MRVVLCNGVFDLLHVAHLRHLQQARRLGGRLVVGLTTDKSATREKRKPIICQRERMEMLRGLKCVSDVIFCKDSLDALRRVKPNVFCKGHDRIERGLLDAEIEYCRANNIDIRFTQKNPQTTTNIIRRIKCESR